MSDTAEDVKKKVMQMYTDPKRVRADIPGTVEGNPVFTYHDAFNPNTAEVDDLKDRYRAGKVGDVEVKTKLAAALNAHLEPIRERRAARARASPTVCKRFSFEGPARARAVARQTMERVREAMKIAYNVSGPTMDQSHDFESSRVDAFAGPPRATSKARSTCCCTSSRRTR